MYARPAADRRDRVSVFNQKTTEFEFRPGPVFAQVLLADEINRTTPRTQAALLEAMAEGRVTVDGITHDLEPPFLVIATQNPIDHEGTFPLPEAQLDRFLVRFSLGYPTMDEELKMLEMLEHGHPVDKVEEVVSARNCSPPSRPCSKSSSTRRCARYITQIVQDTRKCEDLSLGAARGRRSRCLDRAGPGGDFRPGLRAARRRQADGRRGAHAPLILRPESRLRKLTAAAVVAEVVAEVPVPMIAQNRRLRNQS